MARNDVLTDTERKYLNDPDRFDRADSTIRKMNHDLRKKYQAASSDATLIERVSSGQPVPEPPKGTIPNPGDHPNDSNQYYPAAGTENRYTLLTPTERQYLMEPEEYAENHADSTVAVMKSNIRKKHENWQQDWELLWETREVWDRVWLTMTTYAKCVGCGWEEEEESDCWEATDYNERFEDWVEEYGVPSKRPPSPSHAHGFCPDCSHIRKDSREMAIEDGKVPCYNDRCQAKTHKITTKIFRDCWARGVILLTIDDMETIIDETDIDDDVASQIRGLYE